MSTFETTTPYVVSADVAGLFKEWAHREGYQAPSDQYFNDLTIDLKTRLIADTGASVEIVDEAELRDGIGRSMAHSPYPVISLDRAYISKGDPRVAGYIDMTRAVNERHEGVGIFPRPGFASVEQQIEALRTREESPITLVDDVIFSGEGIVDLARKLRDVNRPVAQVIAGIGIREGIQKLEDDGVEVTCVRTYEDVMDEVCERDFLAGVPMSGRTIISDNGERWSAPYFEPFGNAEGWASIPARTAQQFSRFCLEQSIELWHEVEHLSGRRVPANEISRRIKLIDGDHSVVTALQRHL